MHFHCNKKFTNVAIIFSCKNESLLLLVYNERNFSLENIVSIILPLKRNVLDVGLIFNGDQIQFIMYCI
jgi:hypothetical protein